MKVRSFITLVIVILVLGGCRTGGLVEEVRGSGSMATEEREVEGVRGVTLANMGDLTIALGEQESLVIEAEDNLLPYLETVARNGMLTIGTKRNTNLRPTAPIHYILTVNSIESLTVNSSGNIEAPAIDADIFTVEINSSGDIHVPSLHAASIKVDISSSGDVTIDAGEVTEQEISITSSGKYEAEELRSERATVDISSNGDTNIWVTDSIDATLSSSGNLNYYGGAEVEQSTTSSGKVVSLGDR